MKKQYTNYPKIKKKMHTSLSFTKGLIYRIAHQSKLTQKKERKKKRKERKSGKTEEGKNHSSHYRTSNTKKANKYEGTS